jgi:bifunctional non-homologous end joining protein LigD
VLGPDGLSRFEKLSHREAARTAILCAFDPIEHDGEDLRNLPFLDRRAALARLLRDAKAGILLNEHVADDGPTVFAHACRLGAEGIVSKRVDGTYQSGPCRVWIKVRNPASIAVQRERSEIWNRRASGSGRAGDDPPQRRNAGLARSRYGRGLKAPHHLTVFNRPSPRVKICRGKRMGRAMKRPPLHTRSRPRG